MSDATDADASRRATRAVAYRIARMLAAYAGTRSKSQEVTNDGARSDNPRALRQKTLDDLRKVWLEWRAGLPAEAGEWPRGAGYIRESHTESLEGEQPLVQLDGILAEALRDGYLIEWRDIYFDDRSGTELESRPEFMRLIAAAEAGSIKRVFAYASNRLFRNEVDALQTVERLRRVGVELTWVGRPKLDPRSPAAWMIDSMMFHNDENMPRQAAYFIGMNLMRLSAGGQPLGHLPETWQVAQRAPTLKGHLGRPIRYRRVYPLARIVREGAKRYLTGSSLRDLADWALTTELKGLTPAGRLMERGWWRTTLMNPKLAGLHKPSEFTGYKPGKRSEKRPRRNRQSELVACNLPRVITKEEHQAISRIALGRTFHHGTQRTYQASILSGLATDIRCDHTMNIQSSSGDSRRRMRCAEATNAGTCEQTSFYVDDAEQELRDLVGAVAFSDKKLVADVERELALLEAEHGRAAANPPPSREVVELRRALAALSSSTFGDIRRDLERRLLELETKDAQRNASTVAFRASIDDLKRWPEVVRSASEADINDLLRTSLAKVWVGPTRRLKRGRAAVKGTRASRIVGIEARDPVFGAALATALTKKAKAVSEDEWREMLGSDDPTVLAQLSNSRLVRMARPAGLEPATF